MEGVYLEGIWSKLSEYIEGDVKLNKKALSVSK
jgi:hypothetical protein